MPLTNHQTDWWKKSRCVLNTLFEGYCKDYGGEDGAKIIKTVIDVLGGCRLTIPVKFPSNPENTAALVALYACLSDRFGDASGKEIMRKFIIELAGLRISFPDYEDLAREERNRKIKTLFNGNNYRELSIRFDLSFRQVWGIVNEK